uniref:Ig-like domain-containing protein n=1 Tax=Callorhinchus milii TaxID=7868 RepID=A0A4W3K5C7_CALMI
SESFSAGVCDAVLNCLQTCLNLSDANIKAAATGEVWWQVNRMLQNSLAMHGKVLGSEDGTVRIYIRVNENSPHILCATAKLRNTELMDPEFSWQGPNGRDLAQNDDTRVSLTGTLSIERFQKEYSGEYTCIMFFYTSETKALQSLTLKYLLYAYQQPNYTYEFQAQYHVANCLSANNNLFLDKLHTALNQLVSGLAYVISIYKSDCHMLKVPLAGIQYELFLTFKVHLKEEQLERICKQNSADCNHNLRLEKARHRMQEFFGKQADILHQINGSLPLIYYIDGTLQVIRIDRCNPGYGKDRRKHMECSGCCVVCSPGSYSGDHRVSCLPCASAVKYGETDCKTE